MSKKTSVKRHLERCQKALEILKGKGWSADGVTAVKETGFEYRVVYHGSGWPTLRYDSIGGEVDEAISEEDLCALVEATNAGREAAGEGPLFVSPQQQDDGMESDEAARRKADEAVYRKLRNDYARELAQATSGWAAGWAAVDRGCTHSFTTDEVRRMLWAMRFSADGSYCHSKLLRDLIAKAEGYVESATGEKP